MVTFIFTILSLILITIGLIQWTYFTGDTIDHTNIGNKYNKYKIYSSGKGYFCKMDWLYFWCYTCMDKSEILL